MKGFISFPWKRCTRNSGGDCVSRFFWGPKLLSFLARTVVQIRCAVQTFMMCVFDHKLNAESSVFACRKIGFLFASCIGECFSRVRAQIRLLFKNGEYGSKSYSISKHFFGSETFNSIRENSVLWLLKEQITVLAISCSSIPKSRFQFCWRISLNCETGAVVGSRQNQSKLLETLMKDPFFALVELFFLFTIALVCRTVLSTFIVVVLSLSVVVKTGWKLCRPLVFVKTN